jgi:protein KRI1
MICVALQELDLEGDWDPDAHDKQMSKIYGLDEGDFGDDEKPIWDDDIDITDIVPEESESKKKKKKKKKKAGEEQAEDGVDVDDMDADVVKQDDEEWDGTEEMRKRKLDEYMDELYGLEFNDMVCGI